MLIYFLFNIFLVLQYVRCVDVLGKWRRPKKNRGNNNKNWRPTQKAKKQQQL